MHGFGLEVVAVGIDGAPARVQRLVVLGAPDVFDGPFVACSTVQEVLLGPRSAKAGWHHLSSSPDESLERSRRFTLRVDRYSRISVRTNRYSVPVRQIGRTVRVVLQASEPVLYDGREEGAWHERLIARAVVPGSDPGGRAALPAGLYGKAPRRRPRLLLS
ncbi:Mu transposase domain-containing protein [Streptomyces virginiae]